jgi:hypothetical protein
MKMRKAWQDVKSFVTILLTIAMVVLIFVPFEVNKEVLMLFSSTYGAVITYYFTRKDTENS